MRSLGSTSMPLTVLLRYPQPLPDHILVRLILSTTTLQVRPLILMPAHGAQPQESCELFPEPRATYDVPVLKLLVELLIMGQYPRSNLVPHRVALRRSAAETKKHVFESSDGPFWDWRWIESTLSGATGSPYVRQQWFLPWVRRQKTSAPRGRNRRQSTVPRLAAFERKDGGRQEPC
jgi:hypothetical protein